ncbi:MAG: hypothetical protein CMJ81_07125 [Planctomycetaceae bacterium]|nr:hypothetical protein [Planctomycetaceae bacterium]MBP61240.1 hypothetical protein [Planctomycetaceae bacterium]
MTNGSYTPGGARLLASNIVYSTVSIVTGSVALFVGNWAVIHWYGSGFHGNLVWLISVTQIALVASDFGLANKAGVRTIARLRAEGSDRLNQAVSSVVYVPIFVAAVLAACMFMFGEILADARPGVDASLVRWAASWIVLSGGIRACRAVAIGCERSFNILLMVPLAEILKTTWIFVCAAANFPAEAVFYGWTGAWAVALAVSLVRLRTLLREFAMVISLTAIRTADTVRVVLEALPFHVQFVGLIGLPFILQLILGSWYVAEESTTRLAISSFQVCFSLALIPRLLGMPISTSLLPRIVHLSATPEDGHDQIDAILQQLTRLLGVAGTLVFALLCTWGPALLTFLYPAEYAGATVTLLILVAAVGIDNYSLQLDQVLMATQYAKIVAFLEVLRYGTLILATWFLVPESGVTGAAVSVLIASGINVAGKVVVTCRTFSPLGLGPFAQTLFVGGLITATLLSGHAALCMPVWAVGALILGLLRPREIWGWVLQAKTIVLTGA